MAVAFLQPRTFVHSPVGGAPLNTFQPELSKQKSMLIRQVPSRQAAPPAMAVSGYQVAANPNTVVRTGPVSAPVSIGVGVAALATGAGSTVAPPSAILPGTGDMSQRMSNAAALHAFSTSTMQLEPRSDASPNVPAMYFCDMPSQWLGPDAARYRASCVSRPSILTREQYQIVIDQLVKSYGQHVSLEECVELEDVRNSLGGVRAEASKVAEKMLSDLNLPEDLLGLMKEDATELCETLSKLFPTAEHACMKLESFGPGETCGQWHQDHYVARSLVCYCGPGTEYSEDDNIDWNAFENASALMKALDGDVEAINAHIIKNSNNVKSVKAGDMLLMKGMRCPFGARGLVHKSPLPEYHTDGKTGKNRLLLKVDIHSLKD